MGKKAVRASRTRNNDDPAARNKDRKLTPASERSETGPTGDSDAPSLDAKIAALQNASSSELRAEWRRLFGSDPPRLSRDLLSRAIAYRLQERVFGGLSRASLRRLEEIANQSEGEASPPQPALSLRPGTRLVREWHGRAHVVTVTETGFEYSGSSYRSLTEIAKIITGAHWSGPRFFGLTSRKLVQAPVPVASSNGALAPSALNPAIDIANPTESARV